MKFSIKLLLLSLLLCSSQYSFCMDQETSSKSKSLVLTGDPLSITDVTLPIIFSFAMPDDDWSPETLKAALKRFCGVCTEWNKIIKNKNALKWIVQEAISRNISCGFEGKLSTLTKIQPFFKLQDQSGKNAIIVNASMLGASKVTVTQDNLQITQHTEPIVIASPNQIESVREKILKSLELAHVSGVLSLDPGALKNVLTLLHPRTINLHLGNGQTLLDTAIAKFSPLSSNEDNQFITAQNIILLIDKGAYYFQVGNKVKKIAFFRYMQEKLKNLYIKMSGINGELSQNDAKTYDNITEKINEIKGAQEDQEFNESISRDQYLLVERFKHVQNAYIDFIGNKFYQSVSSSDAKTFIELFEQFPDINLSKIIKNNESLADVAIANMAKPKNTDTAYGIFAFLMEKEVEFIKEDHFVAQKAILFNSLLQDIQNKISDHNMDKLFALQSLIKGKDQTTKKHNLIFKKINALYQSWFEQQNQGSQAAQKKTVQSTVYEKRAELTDRISSLQLDPRFEGDFMAIIDLSEKLNTAKTMEQLLVVHANLNNLLLSKDNPAKAETDEELMNRLRTDEKLEDDPREQDASHKVTQPTAKSLATEKERLKNRVNIIMTIDELLLKHTEVIFALSDKIDQAHSLEEIAKIETEICKITESSKHFAKSLALTNLQALAFGGTRSQQENPKNVQEIARRKPLLRSCILKISEDTFFFADLGHGGQVQKWMAELDAATTLYAVQEVQNKVFSFIQSNELIRFDLPDFIIKNKLY